MRTNRRARYLFSLLLLLPSWAHAFDGRLLLADGSPASGYRVSLVGQTVSVTFIATEDLSLQTSFVLDDITLTAS